MKLNELKPAEGAVKTSKRVGRGQGSGKGGTSARGHKGAKSRSGYKRKIGFEGGQMPLQRRVPKFGFKNINRVEFKGVNLDTIQQLASDHGLTTITHAELYNHGLVSKNDMVKVLGRGELTSKLVVEAHGYSVTAKSAIENAGGEAKIIG